MAHDTFVAVYRQLDHYDDARPLRPWLCGFAYRMASDYRRLARHRYERMSDDAGYQAPVPSQAQELEARDLTLRALDEVALERRVVLLLHDIDGHSMPEIAAELALPLNTAYSRLRLARQEFRDAVERLQPVGGES